MYFLIYWVIREVTLGSEYGSLDPSWCSMRMRPRRRRVLRMIFRTQDNAPPLNGHLTITFLSWKRWNRDDSFEILRIARGGGGVVSSRRLPSRMPGASASNKRGMLCEFCDDWTAHTLQFNTHATWGLQISSVASQKLWFLHF